MLAGARISAVASLLLAGRAVGDRLDVSAVAVVLSRQPRILAMQIGDLLAEPLADIRLLRKCIGGPSGDDCNHQHHDGATNWMRAAAHIARGNYGFAVSHAASLVDIRVDECRL